MLVQGGGGGGAGLLVHPPRPPATKAAARLDGNSNSVDAVNKELRQEEYER